MLKIKYIFYLFILAPLALLAEAKQSTIFSNGNVDAQIQLFHYNIEKQDAPYAYATAFGGFLKYTTDTDYDIFASLRFHTSNSVGDSLNKTKTHMFNNDKDGKALTTISESFLAYKTSSRVMKLGNLMLNTPMMNDDTTRIVPWSYQGFAYTGTAIKDTKVQLYYINAIRSHTSDKYIKESASGEIGNSGVTMLGIHYKGIKSIHLQSYYYYAPELYSTLILQADHTYLIKDNTLICAGFQYFKSGDGGEYADSTSANGGDDINLVALKASIDMEDWLLSINYSQNFGLSGIVKGYGGLAKVYTTSMIANGRGNFKPETWMLKSSYNLPFNSHDSEVALWLTNTYMHDSRGDGFSAYYLHFKHYFNKEASIFLRYEKLNYTTDKSDSAYFRVIAKYEF